MWRGIVRDAFSFPSSLFRRTPRHVRQERPEKGRISGTSQVSSETEARISIRSLFASGSPGEWSRQERDRMLPSGLGELDRERDRNVSLEVKASRVKPDSPLSAPFSNHLVVSPFVPSRSLFNTQQVKVIGKTPGNMSGPHLLLLHRPLELETRINAHPMQLGVVVRQAKPSVERAASRESDRLHPYAGFWVNAVGATRFDQTRGLATDSRLAKRRVDVALSIKRVLKPHGDGQTAVGITAYK
jgi:hypothetical protein